MCIEKKLPLVKRGVPGANPEWSVIFLFQSSNLCGESFQFLDEKKMHVPFYLYYMDIPR